MLPNYETLVFIFTHLVVQFGLTAEQAISIMRVVFGL